MKKKLWSKPVVTTFIGAALAAALTTLALADVGHSHSNESDIENTSKAPARMNMDHVDQAHGHRSGDAHHAHDNWVKPPKEYANKQTDKWASVAAIQRGMKIYQQ